MAKINTRKMIALLEADIKFAMEIGDTDFAAVMADARDKILEADAKRKMEYFAKFKK